jgi:predicted secreted Zn-dependent protease
MGATSGDGNGGATSGAAGRVGGGAGTSSAGAAGARAGGAGIGGAGGALAGAGGAGGGGNGGGAGMGGTGPTSCDDPLAVGDTSRFTATDSLETYSISGDTADELRASLNENRGMDYDAYTSWTIQWTYDDCSDPAWSLSLAISYIMPEWDPPPGADPALVDRWSTYIDALYCHEYGHGDLAIDCANDLLDALEQIPGTSDCGALLDSASQVTDTVIADCNDADIEYDDATNHGATMGAVFP